MHLKHLYLHSRYLTKIQNNLIHAFKHLHAFKIFSLMHLKAFLPCIKNFYLSLSIQLSWVTKITKHFYLISSTNFACLNKHQGLELGLIVRLRIKSMIIKMRHTCALVHSSLSVRIDIQHSLLLWLLNNSLMLANDYNGGNSFA